MTIYDLAALVAKAFLTTKAWDGVSPDVRVKVDAFGDGDDLDLVHATATVRTPERIYDIMRTFSYESVSRAKLPEQLVEYTAENAVASLVAEFKAAA